MTYSATPSVVLQFSARPLRYRSLQTLLLLTVVGSIASSYWLLPSQLERVMAASERGDQPVLDHELARAADGPTDPGETRALADVALTLGEPEVAATILEQALARQPDSLTAMRRLLEIQRQRHRMSDVAALDERIYAHAGDPEALREAADIYASQHRTDDRLGALRRLNDIGRATASDVTELAHRLFEAGAGPEASVLVMDWLNGWTKSLPAEVVGLAAWLTANDADAQATATRLGSMIGRSGEIGPFHVLIQTYAERGRADLSLVAGLALGEPMQTDPEVALLLAQLEAQQGQFAAARRRLDALDSVGTLPAVGASMLAELSLQAGDLARAAALTGTLTADQMPQELPRRLVDAAFAADRPDALTRLAIEPIAASWPGSAAVIALAQGNRVQAQILARRALSSIANLDDLGPAFGGLVKTLRLQPDLVALLLNAAKASALGDQELSLLIDLSTTSGQVAPAVMQALRAQRDLTPRAGLVWAAAAARAGGVADVTAWLQVRRGEIPTDTLLGLLQIATERGSGDLARTAISALSGRSNLPDGWTPAEIAFAARATEPMTMARLREGLSLIGTRTSAAAKDRLVASLVGARNFTVVAKDLRRSPENDGVVDWLIEAGTQVQSPDELTAHLGLLSSIAPHRSLPLLAGTWARDPRHLLPLYVAALIRDHQADLAQTVLATGLRSLGPKQQDTILYDTLAGLHEDEALPLLRLGARLERDEWVSAYQDALSRAGLFEELQAELRTQASSPGMSSTRRLAIASRLVELNDRVGAIAILEKLATGLRPSSAVVEQLVFLWGPRAEPDAIKWAHDRASVASFSDFPKWLDHLAYLGAPRAVIEMVEARPAILGVSAQAVRTYGAALIATDSRIKPNLAAAIASNSAPDVSDALAQLALDTGQAHAAWRATRGAASATSTDAAALLLAAQSSAAVRRSSEAATLYARLLALGPQDVAIMIDAGDAMLTAKQVEAGRRVLTTALVRLPTTPTTLESARQRARALMLLKRSDEAIALLKLWLARFPGEAGLQADLLQARLDGAGSDQ